MRTFLVLLTVAAGTVCLGVEPAANKGAPAANVRDKSVAAQQPARQTPKAIADASRGKPSALGEAQRAEAGKRYDVAEILYGEYLKAQPGDYTVVAAIPSSDAARCKLVSNPVKISIPAGTEKERTR